MKTAAALALLGCALEASAIFAPIVLTSGTAATTATTGTITLAGGTGTALALGGGLLLLKGLAVAGLAIAASRSKRSPIEIDNADAAFAVIAANEPAQCYRRLICDLATGEMPKSQNEVILSLFDKEAGIESARFEFETAAKLGKQVKSVQLCEVRYSCPLSGSQIEKLFA